MYEIGKHYSLNKIFYACVIMVCFAACVIVSLLKNGGKKNEKEGQHTHALLCFVCGTGLALVVKNGVSAFFVVVLFCEFITPSS